MCLLAGHFSLHPLQLLEKSIYYITWNTWSSDIKSISENKLILSSNMSVSEYTEKSMEVKQKHETSLYNLYSPHASYNKWWIITKELPTL